jgi:hypothetical protein
MILKDKGMAKDATNGSAAEEIPKTPGFSVFMPIMYFNTPTSSQDLLRSCRKSAIEVGGFDISAQRLVTWKAAKALDHQAKKIANLETKVQYLETKVTTSVKKKRKKAKPTPGRRLVMMADVRKVQRRLRRKIVYKDEASDYEVPTIVIPSHEAIPEDKSEVEDCIVIENA